MTSIKWNGREVQNPTLRAVATVAVIFGVAFAMVFGALGLMIAIPLSMPFHPLLRLLGRRGFMFYDAEGSLCYAVDAAAFKRVGAGSR